ncbi:hypothetical protein [Treponema sp. OMZ 799]|uniref:hypothetical protein n=1 Tax=Treponema sp. OMZ 799 TaxID=2563668 RepID=UPI0020A3E2B3|nr:hypothetical protein [Treponema sp. OMZ 799]
MFMAKTDICSSAHKLQEDATIRNFRIVQTEGDRTAARSVKYYGLQMIIAVGFLENTISG